MPTRGVLAFLPAPAVLSLGLEWLLRSSVMLVLLGHAIQHLFWGGPYSALIWNQELLQGLVASWLGWDWQRWATSRAVFDGMQFVTHLNGGFFLLSACCAFWRFESRSLRRAQSTLLSAAALLLALLAALQWLDKTRQVGQLLEAGLQCALPLVLALGLRQRMQFGGVPQLLLRLAIAATFAGHGLYAAGFYEVPGYFVTMVMRCLGVSEPTASSLLVVAGVLDFGVAALVLAGLVRPVLDAPVLLYAGLWGGLTALARVVSAFRWDMALSRLWESGHETLVRLPHGLAPLFLLMLAGRRVARAPSCS